MSQDGGIRPNKGPWGHRALIVLFTVTLGVLFFWLLGFVLDDIGSWPGPSYAELENAQLDPVLLNQQSGLEKQIAAAQQAIEDNRERQSLLRDSTSNSEQTMNQLLQMQKLSLEKDVAPSQEEQKALAESQRRFLANQEQYQTINERQVELNEKLRQLRGQQKALEDRVARARAPIHEDYQRLLRRHELKVASAKLGVLLPLLILGVFLFLRARGTLYAPLTYAVGIAIVAHVAMVMHEYFPSRYFKYVLIVTALAVVLRVLVLLLRMVAHPKRDWLLKQYREAYERFLCPKCSYPIRRGPLKYLFWTRRSLAKLATLPGSNEAEEAYTCPLCVTPLFEECPACHAIRHALLPACQHCGATRVVEA